jgi:hypothetical protein
MLTHSRASELEAGLGSIRRSPANEGLLDLIVRRPRIGEREVLEVGELDVADGLTGDGWKLRGSPRSHDGLAHADMQLTVMSSRVIGLIAQDRSRWPLAGDQLYVDLDLSVANLPAGARIEIGSAVIAVTDQPHTGCGKFVERFGVDAMKLVNSPLGRQLRLRGLNARVVQAGVVRVGDVARVRRQS